MRSISTVVETAREIWREPVEIMAAIGHGRSYGRDSRVLGRKISGIFPSPLWKDLQTRAPLETVALVTDVGNDLGYQVRVDEIASWVDGCLAHLERARATTVITELPLARMERLSEREFLFFRTLFFPKARITFDELRADAYALNARLQELGERRKISVIPASGAWYGRDPIHLRRAVWREAWPTILSAWHEREPLSIRPRASFARWAYLRSLKPAERVVFGRAERTAQPSGMLRDGTTISLY
ncbi:MAG: hypothetical protein AB7G28_16755 [Pirellulales bacterium]